MGVRFEIGLKNIFENLFIKRSATGEIVFNTAEMHPELLVQLKDAMDCVNNCELDAGFCQCIRAKSLALQIQWEICELRDKFFVEHQLRRESQNMCKRLIKK